VDSGGQDDVDLAMTSQGPDVLLHLGSTGYVREFKSLESLFDVLPPDLWPQFLATPHRDLRWQRRFQWLLLCDSPEGTPAKSLYQSTNRAHHLRATGEGILCRPLWMLYAAYNVLCDRLFRLVVVVPDAAMSDAWTMFCKHIQALDPDCARHPDALHLSNGGLIRNYIMSPHWDIYDSTLMVIAPSDIKCPTPWAGCWLSYDVKLFCC
jgi:hypothetical protein